MKRMITTLAAATLACATVAGKSSLNQMPVPGPAGLSRTLTSALPRQSMPEKPTGLPIVAPLTSVHRTAAKGSPKTVSSPCAALPGCLSNERRPELNGTPPTSRR